MKLKAPFLLAATLILVLVSIDAAHSYATPIASPAAKKKVKKRTTKKKTRVTKGKSSKRRTAAKRSRRGRRNRRAVAVNPAPTGVPADRVEEIQSALIQRGYLSGSPTGQYDASTIQAMKRFQSDNRLSATGYPTAHALKRLGVSKRSGNTLAVPVKATKPEKAAEESKTTSPIID